MKKLKTMYNHTTSINEIKSFTSDLFNKKNDEAISKITKTDMQVRINESRDITKKLEKWR